MKKTIKFAAALLIGTSLLSTGCLEETFPQQGDRHRGSGGRCAERLQQLRHGLHLDPRGRVPLRRKRQYECIRFRLSVVPAPARRHGTGHRARRHGIRTVHDVVHLRCGPGSRLRHLPGSLDDLLRMDQELQRGDLARRRKARRGAYRGSGHRPCHARLLLHGPGPHVRTPDLQGS